MAAETAVSAVLRIMLDAATPAAVRLAAAKDVLDRAGVTEKQAITVDMNVRRFEDVYEELLVDDGSDEDVQDAELVEDTEAEADRYQASQRERKRVQTELAAIPPRIPGPLPDPLPQRQEPIHPIVRKAPKRRRL